MPWQAPTTSCQSHHHPSQADQRGMTPNRKKSPEERAMDIRIEPSSPVPGFFVSHPVDVADRRVHNHYRTHAEATQAAEAVKAALGGRINVVDKTATT
jgi:hypothetical protein